MGAVGADRELELQDGFVRLDSSGVSPLSQLSPDLGELARPERQDGCFAPVALTGVVLVVGKFVPTSGEPALAESVVAGHVEAAGALLSVELLAPAAKELAAQPQHLKEKRR